MDVKLASLLVFLGAYLLFIFLPNRRALVAAGGAGLLILLRVMTPGEAFSAVNWNVMGIFVGTLAVADVFMVSRVPAFLAEEIVNRAKNTAWSLLLICVLTSFISAFVENVATVLIVAPIALSLARKLKIDPINIMIAIAVASNLQGTATLIGDPPSMLLGGYTGMNFGDFFFYHNRPSIFWAVEIGALFSFIVLYLFFRHYREKAVLVRTEKVRSWWPTVMLVSLIVLLAGSSFIPNASPYTSGAICLLFGLISLIWGSWFNEASLVKGLKSLDWETTFFLAGVFILVGSVTQAGWIQALSQYLASIVGQNVLLAYCLLIVFSLAISAFVDNVPYLAAMLPVASALSLNLGTNPSLLLFALLIGASLGGNITPIGASANIVACSLAKKEGYPISFGQFFRLGFPFTITAVSTAAVFVWFIWR